MKISAQFKFMGLALLLLAQGACVSKPLLYSLGEQELAVEATAWAKLTEEEWAAQEKKSCLTHLYRCDFNDQGQVTAVEALDLSRPQFKDFTEESIKNWKFKPGKAGQCFLDFVYTNDGETRIFILQKDHAPQVAAARAQARHELANSVNKAKSIKQVWPRYPKGALIRGEIGLVSLRFDVNPEGVPENIQVVESRPEKIFDSVARTAIRQWRYKPLAEEPDVIRNDVGITFYFNIEGNLGYDCDLGY
jgi:TonB family protein